MILLSTKRIRPSKFTFSDREQSATGSNKVKYRNLKALDSQTKDKEKQTFEEKKFIFCWIIFFLQSLVLQLFLNCNINSTFFLRFKHSCFGGRKTLFLAFPQRGGGVQPLFAKVFFLTRCRIIWKIIKLWIPLNTNTKSLLKTRCPLKPAKK